jgi:hypothetical protein
MNKEFLVENVFAGMKRYEERARGDFILEGIL